MYHDRCGTCGKSILTEVAQVQKTLNEMAKYSQKLLPPEIPKAFEIDAMFYSVSDYEGIKNGIVAFRDFMYRLYSRLCIEGGTLDKPKKELHEFSDNTNIPTAYPFLCNVAVFLINMGVHGKLNDRQCAVLLADIALLTAKNHYFNAKIPDAKKIEVLKFLTNCGMHFDGLDLSGKKPILLSPMVITYPENPEMLTGLKVMATAECEYSTRFVHDILLRCDYRVLANKKIELLPLLTDLVTPLSADVQEFVLNLHQNYMNHGYKCDTYIGNSIRFEYFCRSKELWRFNVSLNNGHNITIKALNTDNYTDIVRKLPEWLQIKIEKGYGCGKKMGITGSCDGGCRGFRIPLNDSFMEISDLIETWIAREVSCIQGKK
jgi:hypothetical protein